MPGDVSLYHLTTEARLVSTHRTLSRSIMSTHLRYIFELEPEAAERS